MDLSADSRRSLLPSFLYSSSAPAARPLGLNRLLVGRTPSPPPPPAGDGSGVGSFQIQAPSEPGKIAMYSPMFYAACTAGGMACCGLTHMAVTPLDLVKCNMQIDPAKYKSISSGFGVLLKVQGARGFFRGWVPTLLGYSAQGACKFGFYEFFKKYYSDIAGPEYAAKYKTLIYLAGSASAEVIADIALCPMEAVKIDPAKYKSISSGFGVLLKEQGARGFFRGWVPTLLGYSAQGACKYGFYEFFKKYYSDIAGPEYAAKYKILIYLAGSASAEVIADIALCPMEAVKVRVQTQPGFARGLSDGLPKFVKAEGYGGLYKGLVPLWGRQIPYTMMKFASFETIVEMIYKYAMPLPKEQYNKSLQLGVSCAGGYVAGVFCAIVSHPADNLVSFLNNAKGATVGDAVKKLGMWGLFTRGLPLRIVMIGTLTGAQWGIYDAFKVMVGLPTTGGAAPVPAALPPPEDATL